MYREALRVVKRRRKMKMYDDNDAQQQIKATIRAEFERFKSITDASAVSHLLSDARVRLKLLGEIVDMSI